MTEKKKALLINPPTGKYMRDDRCQAPVGAMTAQPARAPMDLAYMAAVLERGDVICRIRDYPFEKKNWDSLRKELSSFQPDYLVISTTTSTFDFDMIACRLAKETDPSIITIAKGGLIYENAESVLGRFPDLDIAIWGEYESAIGEIVQNDPGQVKGISYRKGDEIHRNEARLQLSELESFPLPARHLLNNNLYRSPDTNKPIAYILTGRGCPHRCIFCGINLSYGQRLIKRSVPSIIIELEECYHRYGITDFFFRSDTFTWDEEWVIELCKEIVDRKLKIRWGTNSRVDTINEKRIVWMKKAGCYVIGFGIESGNQAMLDKMKKKTTLQQARRAVALCSQFKIKSYLLFLLGLPWDTKESAVETIEFAKELDGDFADFNIAYPFPGTAFHDIAQRERLFEGSLTGFDYGKPIVKSHTLSTKELIDLRKRAIREFYLRPAYIVKSILNIRNFTVFISYIKRGILLLIKLLSKDK
jgi:anaerobic magnesium-protoporphyrin IX monomethyl ester cyclase